MSDDRERAQELHALLDRLALRIRNVELVDRALTHASIGCETSQPARDYETLEFLGDAALGLAIAHELLERAPDRTPGEYSRMRAGLVNRKCLAKVAKGLDIAGAIRLGKGEELSGGRQRAALLADCLEALIGAVYLDRGWEYARAFVIRLFGDEVEQAVTAESVWDYKSRLQHFCQAERIGLPRFEVVRSEGPDHRKEFEVEVLLRDRPSGRGVGSSKKEAEQNAAREALAHEGQRLGRATNKVR
ncbi:MAG: ribonuclease III [Candidatus Hydrogenedentes bacterium]|nr:ribonuclease III [Candidatus Hydrogenedentota bacterium]